MKKLLNTLILIFTATAVLTNQVIMNKNNEQIIEKIEDIDVNYKKIFIEEIKNLIKNLGELPEHITQQLNQLIEKINNFPNDERINCMFKAEYYMSLRMLINSILNTFYENGNIVASEKLIEVLEKYSTLLD